MGQVHRGICKSDVFQSHLACLELDGNGTEALSSSCAVAGDFTSIALSLPFGLSIIKSSPFSAAYMRQWAGSTLVQIMACRLIGAKPLSKQMVGYFVKWTLRNKLQWNFNQNTKFFIHGNVSENTVCDMAAILSGGRWVEAHKICEIKPQATVTYRHHTGTLSSQTDTCSCNGLDGRGTFLRCNTGRSGIRFHLGKA